MVDVLERKRCLAQSLIFNDVKKRPRGNFRRGAYYLWSVGWNARLFGKYPYAMNKNITII
jgi:hypothetical protein